MEECVNYETPKEAQGEIIPSKHLTINDLIALMVSAETVKQFKNANSVIEEWLKQADETIINHLLKIKEEASDIIAAQFDALKANEIAQAVKEAVAEAKAAANMETFNKIIAQYSRGEIISRIDDLVAENRNLRNSINSKRQTLRSVRQSLADAELALKEAEAGLLADIMAETIPGSDKPRFSNDKARQAELMARKKTDPDYLAAANQHKAVREQVEALEDEIYSLEADLKTTEMQFWAECRVLESLTAEMNILAAVVGAGGKAPVNGSCNCGGTKGTFPAKSQETKIQDKGVW